MRAHFAPSSHSRRRSGPDLLLGRLLSVLLLAQYSLSLNLGAGLLVFDAKTSIASNGILVGHLKRLPALGVLIADESREFRKFMRRQFEAETDFEVVGEVLSGSELLPLARQLKPDVVLVDIALSGMAGLEGARRIKSEMPSALVIFLSVVDEEALREAAARYGADDFLTKGLPISEMFSQIRRRAAREVRRGG